MMSLVDVKAKLNQFLLKGEKVVSEHCPVRNVLSRIGDKWSVLVLLTLAERVHRFMELKSAIGDISQRVLTQTFEGVAARSVPAWRGDPGRVGSEWERPFWTPVYWEVHCG